MTDHRPGEGPQQDQAMPVPWSWTSAFTTGINECLPSTPTLPYPWPFLWQPEQIETCPLHFFSISAVCSFPLSLSCLLPNQPPYFLHSSHWPSWSDVYQASFYLRAFVLDTLTPQILSSRSIDRQISFLTSLGLYWLSPSWWCRSKNHSDHPIFTLLLLTLFLWNSYFSLT